MTRHILTLTAFAAAMLGAAYLLDKAEPYEARDTLQGCITDTECEEAYRATREWQDEAAAELEAYREIQCRQDDQEDVVSIQLNIEFDCYGYLSDNQ